MAQQFKPPSLNSHEGPDKSFVPPPPVEDQEKPVMAQPAPQTFGRGITEFGKQINPVPMITGAYGMVRHPIDTARNIYNAQADELSQVPKLIQEGRYSEAAGHGAAGLIPMIGPAAAKIGETIGGTEPQFDKYGTVIKPGQASDPAGGVGAGAGLIASIAAAPALSRGAGRLLKASARPLVKSALGLPGKAEAFGANPAAAVLEDTSGFRPSKIALTGQQTLTDLDQQLDTVAANTNIRPSLAPARGVLARRAAAAVGSNSIATPSELRPMQRFLEVPRKGFAGDTITRPGITSSHLTPGTPITRIADTQPAGQFLGMKRQFDTDFIRNWNPNVSTVGRLGAAREAYGALADEFRGIPEAAPINKRIQGLIPAVNRAEVLSRGPGVAENIAGRFRARTGALTPALIGREFGGIPGAGAGLVASDLISSPTAWMIPARGSFMAGRILRSPLGQRLIQAPTLLRQNQGQNQ